MAGWIKIHERLLDWKWASCPETLALWIHILLRANYKDSQWCGIEVPRGSLVTSVSRLSEHTGLSVKQVRTSLARLISTNEISSKRANNLTMLTICNYDSYQGAENQKGKPRANQGQTKGKPKANEGQAKGKQYTEIQNKETVSKDTAKKVSELDEFAQKITCKNKQTLDLSFVDEKLSAVFQEFLEMRRKIGKPLKTQSGIKGRYDTLIKLSGGDTELAIKIAKQTISHEWQDFYRLKEETEPQKQENYSNSNYW